MEPSDHPDPGEKVHVLQQENRTLRAALDATECGRIMLRQGEEFSRLLAVSKLIISELDLARACDLVATNAREIVDAELVVVPMLNEGRDEYTYVAASGTDAAMVLGQRFRASVGMCGWVLQNEQSLLFGETSTLWDGERTDWEEGQQSAVLVPLFGREGIIGGLSALGKVGGGCFTLHDLELLTMFANQVSAAIENARLFGQVRQEVEERRRVERALRQSEERLNTILNNVGASIFLKDRQYRYSYVNQAVADLFGAPPEDIVGKRDEAFFSPESVEEIKRSDRPVIEWGETVKREEIGLAVAEDQPRTYWTVKLPLRDGDGAIVGLCGISTDITALKVAEEKLRENEQYIQKVLDTVDEGFIVIDENYRILNANKAYCEHVDMPRDAVIGRSCFEISHKQMRPCYEVGEECAVRHVFATKEPHVVSHRHGDADGNVVYVETKAYPLKDGEGKVVSAIETITNITEKHLLEEERLKTQKLESIGTLAGGIAHDFNNLLQGVFGYLSMAKMYIGERDKALPMLEQAENALNLSVSLTTQLLTFSKGGAPVKKRISLLPVINNAAKFALSGAQSDYRLDIAQDLWEVDADEGQLGQVIQNIVLNAAQAMPEGGTVIIAARNVDMIGGEHPQLPAGTYVEISIRDTGIGIPEKYLPRIFDPYFTTKEKGTGLGLATSYSIVKSHSGLIDVASVPDKGTTFILYLPGVTAAADGRQRSPAATESVRTGRILVMDDEEIVRDLAGEMIHALGHEVEFAECGEVAIEKYQQAMKAGKRFDIVILDLTIRVGLGGSDTIARLLEIDPGVKAIVSSGYSEDAVVAEYEKFGFAGRLTKPYRYQGLREVLNLLLSS